MLPTPRLDGTNNRLAALVDVDVFNANLLRGLAAIPLQGLELSREGALELRQNDAVGLQLGDSV